MPTPTCGHPPINFQLPGANAVMSDIPVELPASPYSLDVDHEQLTVRPCFTAFCLSTDLSSLESDPFTMFMRAN
jgi:hypothetical protein